MSRPSRMLLFPAIFIFPWVAEAQVDKSSRDLIYPVNPPRKAGPTPAPALAFPAPSPIAWPTPSPAPSPSPGERLLKIDEIETKEETGGERTVTARIGAVLKYGIDADKAKVVANFYEESANGAVTVMPSRVKSQWTSPPIDWEETEVLELVCPALAKDSGKTYHGCTIEVFYDNVLQDKWKSSPDLP